MINLFELVEEIDKKFLEKYYEIFEGMEEKVELSKRDFHYLRIIFEAQKINLTEFSKSSGFDNFLISSILYIPFNMG